ncbi:MAG TPA: glycoside hydrolase family 13 [Verrucomicrobiales bacterium]|nr:glycoside hydrolase family 13 [Verrucomicrobiales bacterium]
MKTKTTPRTSPTTKPKATRARKAAAPPAPAVTLKFHSPEATEVFVAGSFNDWQPQATPLRSTRDGDWKGRLKLAPGRYEYLFVVDGTWLPDPVASEAAPNPFGGWNSVLSVR